MKNVILVSVLMFLTCQVAVAQASEKYINAMKAKMPAVDSTSSAAGFLELANAFERIAEAEKTQWLPYYYAALCNVNAGLMMGGPDIMSGNAAKTDPIADKAEKLLNKAEEMMKDNSEIYVVRKQIASLRMMGDVMSRYMTYGPEATAHLEKAKKLNPENPRVYLLEGQDQFFTPEQFGGSKAQAKLLFESALKKFESFKPESEIHPSWGAATANYFLSQIK